MVLVYSVEKGIVSGKRRAKKEGAGAGLGVGVWRPPLVTGIADRAIQPQVGLRSPYQKNLRDWGLCFFAFSSRYEDRRKGE
jgi:hypothetical protein